MNHDDEVGRLGTAYADLIHCFILEKNSIKDHRQKIDKQQDLDKLIHYMNKVIEIVTDLNEWFTAFGSPERKS